MMCDHITHPDHWAGDQGDVIAALGDQHRVDTVTIRWADHPHLVCGLDIVGDHRGYEIR